MLFMESRGGNYMPVELQFCDPDFKFERHRGP